MIVSRDNAASYVHIYQARASSVSRRDEGRIFRRKLSMRASRRARLEMKIGETLQQIEFQAAFIDRRFNNVPSLRILRNNPRILIIPEF